MASARRVVVAGGRGVFGSLLVAELQTRREFDVVAPSRAALDINDAISIRRAAEGAFAVLCAAGPFQTLDRSAVRAVVDAGAHWLDIADDPSWFFGLLDDQSLDEAARKAGVAVLPGLSSLPALSGALVRRATMRAPEARHATITLAIGNRNRKGAAAIASALASGGHSLSTPDRELLRRHFNIESEAFVQLEAPLAGPLFTAIRALHLNPPGRLRVGKILSALSAPLSRFGSDLGSVTVRLGEVEETIAAPGQRMAILPLVFALDELLRHPIAGCHSPLQIDAEALLSFVERSTMSE